METVQSLTGNNEEPDGPYAVLEPLLVRVDKHASAPRDIRVDKTEFRIGRARENDEIILDTSVSRRHCTLRREGSREWTIQDLSSSCTMINDIPIPPGTRQRIFVGDIVQMSPDDRFRYVFTLTLKDESNPQKQHRDREAVGIMFIKEEEIILNSQDCLEKTEKERSENMEGCEKETLRYKHVVCSNEEVQKRQGTLTTCKHEEDRLKGNSKEKLDQTTEQQQNEMKETTESIKDKGTGMQELLTREKPPLGEELNKDEKPLQKNKRGEEVLQRNDGNCTFVDHFEVNNHPPCKILDTIDLTHDTAESSPVSVVTKNTLDTISIIMDEQLTCGICSELFIEATTLNCKHTFCQYCINSWNKKRLECPMCRAPVTSKNGALALDNFIEQMVENLPDGSKQKRKRTVEERRASETSTQRAKKKKFTKKRA